MKCSQKRGCWAQLQLSSCKGTHPPHIPDNTDICHTPCLSHIGELWHGGSGTLSFGQKHSAGRVQEAMLHSSVVTGISQHAKKRRAHTHARSHGVRSNVIPSLSANKSWQGECRMSLCWLANDRWSPGAIRQTNDGFIRTCHWQVMNAALSKPYLEHDKNWKRGGSCYVGCSQGFVCVSSLCF